MKTFSHSPCNVIVVEKVQGWRVDRRIIAQPNA
jgi:hypothetical protein